MIDYFYVPISGYAYLGERRLMALASRHHQQVNFYPVSIGAVFQAAGVQAPAAQAPSRVNYRRMDLARTADRFGLPINPVPRHWPVDPTLACQVIYAAIELGLEPHVVSFALLRAVYAEHKNVADFEDVKSILDGLGLDAKLILARVQSDSVESALKTATKRAIDLGVNGSPTYFLDGEMFFGQDRLDDMAWRLEQAPKDETA